MRTATLVFVLALSALPGCGARTTLSLGDDAGPGGPLTDAGRPRDGGRPRDAGPRDAGLRDGGGGVVCARDADCPAAVCRASASLVPDDLARLPLECGAPSAAASVGAACHRRTDCDRGLCAVAGVCVRACRLPTDCAAGEACSEIFVPTSRAAMQTLMACVASVAAPPEVRVAGPEPGPLLPGIDVPVVDVLPALEPSALVMWRGEPTAFPFLSQVRARGGAVVFDAFTVTDPPDWGIVPVALDGFVTLLYPNGPRTPASASGFEVSLIAGGSATETERYVATRSGLGQRVDLDLYLVGAMGWESPDGSPPVVLAGVIDELRRVLEPAGLIVGEVRVHEVLGRLRTRFAVLTGAEPPFDASPDLDDLYRLSAGANRPAAHVFLVRMIDGALGIASGIPGPHVLPGTGASGVAIAVDLIPENELAVVIAHEVGHFMGLFHTSEIDGSAADPLPDTPECRADRDTDGDGFLLPFECAGVGGDHVMFWAGSGTVISPQQSEIMRRAFFVAE